MTGRLALRVLGLLLALAIGWPDAAVARDTSAYRLRGAFVPGSVGNRVLLRVQNLSHQTAPDVVPQPQFPLQWIDVTGIAPPMATVAAGAVQDFIVTFDIREGAPEGGGETLTVFIVMGVHVNALRYDIVTDFVTAPVAEGPALVPEAEFVEMADSFKAGSEGNAVVFRVENTTAFPVEGLNLRPELPLKYLALGDIFPQDIDLEPGEVATITAEFSVREDAEVGETDIVEFYFDTVSEAYLPLPKYRLTATIEEGDPVAKCNSAVQSGGDAGGGVEVDLGDFTGKAGFTWQMQTVKDRMDVTVGGVTKTTGCVSGAGTFEFDVLPGARLASVKVVPNCDGTTGTQWSFTFECPLASDVTADGQGNAIDGDGDSGNGTPTGGTTPPAAGPPGQLVPGIIPPTVVGAPVVPAPTPPPPLLPTGARAPEIEDNDSHANPTPIAPGDTLTGTIKPRGDYDHYAITLARQGELTVSFSAVPPEVDIAFRVKDADGRQVWGWQVAPAAGATFEAWADLKTPGDYVIEVRDSHSNAASAQPYAMTTRFIPTADPDEPNDSHDRPTPLAWNAALRANILPRGDYDHYLVEADRMGQLTVAFPQVPPEVDIAFRVLDEAGKQVWGWQVARAAGETLTATADLPAPGPYVIEVRDSHSNARSAVPYEMVASLDPAFDGGEPNNDVASATPLALGAQVWANILPRGDYDHYRVEVPHQGELNVAFNAAPPGVDLAFRVLDAAGTQVWGWQVAPKAGETFDAWADLKARGTYIVEVRDSHSNARSHEPYGMMVTLTPTADAGEPNDDTASATPVSLGVPLRANILPRGDYDHYLVSLPHQGELAVAFTEAPDEIDLAFRVLDAAGTQVRGWQVAPKAGETFESWADLKAPGEYVIEVRDSHSNARSADPYAMTASFTPTADLAEPNDAASSATPLILGTPVRANVLPRGDYDHYAFTAPHQGELTVAFSEAPDGIDLAFRVLDAAGTQVRGWQVAPAAGETFTAWADLGTSGDYVIEVRDSHSNARAPEPYGFTATLRSTMDTGEPNDTWERATPVVLGAEMRGNILPRGDYDHYRFTLPGDTVEIAFTQVPGNLNMAFRILDKAGVQVSGWQQAPRNGETFTGTATLPGAGAYVLEVRDGSSNDRSADPYGFVIRPGQ